MSKVIRLPQNLVMHARRVGRLEGRLPFQQIEHWTRLGKLAENNLELTGQMLLDILNTQSPEL
jgi:hypothetical protein